MKSLISSGWKLEHLTALKLEEKHTHLHLIRLHRLESNINYNHFMRKAAAIIIIRVEESKFKTAIKVRLQSNSLLHFVNIERFSFLCLEPGKWKIPAAIYSNRHGNRKWTKNRVLYDSNKLGCLLAFVLISIRMIPHCFGDVEVWRGRSMTVAFPCVCCFYCNGSVFTIIVPLLHPGLTTVIVSILASAKSDSCSLVSS